MGDKQKKTSARFAILGLCAGAMMGAHTGATAVECKGLEKPACEQNAAQCSWVEPYTRKDGVKVSGHCRKKGGGKKSDG